MMYASDDDVSPFAWNSADVDWCEENYEKTEYIAEYYNTLSNGLFFVIPPLMIYLSRPFSKHITSDINLCWVLLIVVGAGSGYFHATLSLSGQLIDEIGIVWAMMAGCAIAMPKKMFDNVVFQRSRARFKAFLLVLSVLGTLLMFVYPVMNAFLLMSSALPLFAVVGKQVANTSNYRAVRLGFAVAFWWVAAICCWLNDKLFCRLWQEAGMTYPQLHSFWHILVMLATYTSMVLCMYFVAVEERPDLQPKLTYWPWNSFEFGVPFVDLDEPQQTKPKRQ